MKRITTVTILFLVIILFLFFILLALPGCHNEKKNQLDVYVWEGYLPEEVANLFEQETGINLNITYATDTAMMLTLLRGGGKADILMPTHSHVNRFYEDNLAQPLDLKKIINYERVLKSLRDQSYSKWDGKQLGSGEVYVIPYIFGTTGLVINTSLYPKDLDDIGWDILFNNDFKGRVSSKNSVESLWIILDMEGIPRENLITDTQGTLEKTWDEAIVLKSNVLKFYSTGSEIVDLMKNEEVWVAHIWDGGGRQLSQFDPKFKYILPKTGGMAWTDTFLIPRVAENPDGAYLFIDFMLRPDIAGIVTAESGYNTTVEGSLDFAKGINKDLYSFTNEELEKLIWPPNLPEEARSISVAFWEELSTIK